MCRTCEHEGPHSYYPDRDMFLCQICMDIAWVEDNELNESEEDFEPIYTIGSDEPIIYLNKTTGKIIELPFFETSLSNSNTGIKEKQQ